MPMLAAAGGRRHLIDPWTTAPSAVNWQEPLGQDSNTTSPSSWFLFVASMAFLSVFLGLCCCFCRKKDNEHGTNRLVLGQWSNDNDGEAVIAPPPPLQEQEPPESGDGPAPQSNIGEEGDRPPRRRRWQQPAVAEMPAADEEMALGDMQLTQAEVDWMLADLQLQTPAAHMEMAPAADMDMAVAADEEIAPAPEPGPTLKCTYSTADGWDEGTCTVCLSELVDGEQVRVLTTCMHCFHATCIETWLRDGHHTCPLCRALVQIRRRRRRRTQSSA